MEMLSMRQLRTGCLANVVLALVLVAANAMATAAFAAECPADQRKEGVRKAPTDQVWDGGKLQSNAGIMDKITATIDVSQPPVDIKDRTFRLRRLTVQPGGTVPWHEHADRPAIAYLLEGELTEYASNCAVPVVHTAGDVIIESPNISHWWRNFSDKKAVVISADLLKGDDDNM
jgi:quercetin dioxygenase-like cupin family protein